MKKIILVFLIVGTFVALFSLEPISQNLDYHHFVDTRECLGIKNTLNVLSNVPFLFVGMIGLWYLCKKPQPFLRLPWVVLFFGVSGVSFGSAYYHWYPKNATLVWDRLPMTVGFMGLFVGVLAEYFHQQFGKLLIPAIILGGWSVFYWQSTDDLRFYVWVQFMPLLVVAFLLFSYPSPFQHPKYLGIALGLYLLAKVTEVYDKEIFRATGELMSGHTIKHLLAALGCYSILVMLQKQTSTNTKKG